MGKTIAAGIFVVRKDGKLLVCHPTNHASDFWSIPKGKADDGESMMDCALRETLEETNLDLKDAPFFSVHELASVNYGHGKKMIFPFLYWETLNSDRDWETTEIKCNSNVPEERGGFPEMDEYKWVSLEEARSILHATQVACLDKIKEITNKTPFFTLHDGDKN
jgi:8-oxo-dGTP pyrophosphatase MutT (NUDIX family)